MKLSFTILNIEYNKIDAELFEYSVSDSANQQITSIFTSYRAKYLNDDNHHSEPRLLDQVRN